MTITNKGYPGGMDRLGWARSERYAGAEYNVHDQDSYKATKVLSGTDRGITISAGIATGGGVTSESDGNVVVACDTVSSGSRWDMVVLRRNYTTKTTTLVIVNGGSTRALPTRAHNVGTGVDEQPLWLARVTAGQTTVQELVDLRLVVGEGGATAADPLVLDYATRPGVSITIGNDIYTRVLKTDGSVQLNKVSAISMFGMGASMTPGSIPPAGAQMLMQAGVVVQPTDGAGYARVTFPNPFPNGLLHFNMMRGDDASNPDVSFGVAGNPWGIGNKTDVVYRAWGPTGGNVPRAVLANYFHRANWFAIGW